MMEFASPTVTEKDGALRPPYARIEGLDKPVSRIFFGTAIKPMLMGENVDSLLDAVLASGINAFDCPVAMGRPRNPWATGWRIGGPGSRSFCSPSAAMWISLATCASTVA